MEKVLRLIFAENSADLAMHFLKHHLRRLKSLPMSDFVLSNEFRALYSEKAVIPMKKIAS